MMHIPRPPALVGALVLAAMLVLASCGSNGSGTASIALSPVATEGQTLARENGCGSCHGPAGQGGVGPAFVGLFGTEVEFEDGTTAIADRDYLIESIKDPAAKTVAGFRLPMPTNQLTDAQIDLIVTYIEELAQPSEGSAP